MTEILLVNLISIALLAYMFYARTKKLLYKNQEFSKKREEKFVDYAAKIENRIIRPNKDFLAYGRKEDWAMIISFNRKDLILQTLATAKKHEPNIKILVVDNGSKADVIDALISAKNSGIINKLILNTHSEVPQWQKCNAIAQGMKILSLEGLKSLTIMDDDILIEAPWLNASEKILNAFQNVTFVSLMTDEIQEQIHKTIEEVEFEGETVRFKHSFIGTFFYLPTKALIELGLPPFGEGISEASVEDWYYSRLIKAKDTRIATINRCKHLGYDNSIRVGIEKKMKK